MVDKPISSNKVTSVKSQTFGDCKCNITIYNRHS